MSRILENFDLPLRVIKKEEINFGFGTMIGSGGGGRVYKARWCNTVVAVKSVRIPRKEKYIKRELLAMSKIRHPNFVSIMAVSINYSECNLVMEYFENSVNMRMLLFDQDTIENCNLTYEDKVKIALQITVAISYLHHEDLLIIHEDIKPENILVSGTLHVKICDMGLSRTNQMPKELCTTEGKYDRGTPLYTAPELMCLKHPASTQSDVWAVGCVLLELFTGKQVWDSEFSDDIMLLYKEKSLPEGIEHIDCAKLRNLLMKCLSYSSNERPDITTLHKYFYKAEAKIARKKKGVQSSSDSSSASEED